MKFKHLLLLLLITALLTTWVYATQEGTYIWDEADVLTADEEKSLNQELAQISQRLGVDIIAATVNDEAYYVADLGNRFFAEHSSQPNGMILLLAFGTIDNDYYIGAQGETNLIFSDKMYDEVESAFITPLGNHRYASAIAHYATACEDVISSYGKLSVKSILIGLGIGMLLSTAIPMSSLKNQLKSVRSQPEASSYIQQNSIRFTKQTDAFLNRTVSRVRKPKNTSGGHSSRGSSFGGGGSRSSGRSGKF